MEEKETIKSTINGLLSSLGYGGDVIVDEIKEENIRKIRVSVSIEGDAGLIIGKSGDSLRALQHLALLMVSKKTGIRFAPGGFVFDVNNYQKDRETYLTSLAKNTAADVLQTKDITKLPPMPASERRIIHVVLAEVDGVTTASVGDKETRRVVISPIV